MRSRFRRGERVFSVDLTVHQLDSIPAIHRLLYVHWRARRAVPPEGRTPSQPVEPGHVIRWNSNAHFNITIPADPADPTILQPAPLVLQLRSERRGRWLATSFHAEGTVEVDLSDAATVGVVSRNFLVQESLLNTTMKLTIRVSHQSGDKIFRTRALAAPSVSSTHDDTGPDDDSTGTLPPIRQQKASMDGRVERSSSTPFDRTTGAPLPIPTSLPGLSLPGIPSSSTASMSTPVISADGSDPNTSTFAFNNTNESPINVLENSIPNPEIVQRHVYERIFQERVRDEWPAHIIESRVDAVKVVDEIYAAVCAADGIGMAGSGVGTVNQEQDVRRHDSEQPGVNKTLSLEVLIESRNGAPPPPANAPSTHLTRRPSARSPHLSVRSSSMGELSELAKLSDK